MLICRARLRGASAGGHHALVQLLHLLPCRRDGPFLPAAVTADGGAAEEDPVIRFAESRQPIASASAAATAAGEGAQAVGRLLPERAVRRFELGADLRMHLAGVREHVLDPGRDRFVDEACRLTVA